MARTAVIARQYATKRQGSGLSERVLVEELSEGGSDWIWLGIFVGELCVDGARFCLKG